MKKVISGLFLVIALVSCASQQETATLIPTVLIKATETATATVLPTNIYQTNIPRPTRTPLPTIPAATLTAVASLDAIRINLLIQHPELEKYGVSCNANWCVGIYASPNGQNIIVTNSNVIEVFSSGGQRVGVYSFYDLYGYQFDRDYGYVMANHWSKDGRYLYISTSLGNDGGPEAHYESSLVRVNLQNGSWVDTGISGVMSFSPTDQFIAYSTNESEIRILDLQSGEETILFTESYYQYFLELIWSPNGRKIVVAATPEELFADNATFALYLIDLDLKTIYKVHESAHPFFYPVSWTETNKITLHREEGPGEWILDLSTNPPTITP